MVRGFTTIPDHVSRKTVLKNGTQTVRAGTLTMSGVLALLRERARKHASLRLAYGKLDALIRYFPMMRARPVAAVRFLLADPEADNYTYEIANRDELAAFLAKSLVQDVARIRGYITELDHDDDLRDELSRLLSKRRDRRHVPLYGRRLGWYALVRARRPRRAIEVGVHDGLGASVLLRALERNRAEGFDGDLIGIDLDPTAGWLVPERLRQYYALVIEHSQAALPRVATGPPINLFIADGAHSAAGETADYQAVLPGLAPDAVLISDQARRSDALAEFARKHGRSYAFWAEEAIGHFWPGEGIGLSLAAHGRF
jgi:predicted O-methyltransferase YrrM